MKNEIIIEEIPAAGIDAEASSRQALFENYMMRKKGMSYEKIDNKKKHDEELTARVKLAISRLVRGIYFAVSLAFAATLGYCIGKLPVIDTEQKLIALIISAMLMAIIIFITMILFVFADYVKHGEKNKKSQ
jgi:hypothetical protein